MAARRPRRPVRTAAVSVEINDRQRTLRVSQDWLERVARAALAAEQVEAAELCILVVGDRKIARLHEDWLEDSSPTDVITFDLTEPGTTVLRGDIVVSAETAARVARQIAAGRPGWTARHELAYYVVHGILHLTGYDDRTTADRRTMRARERAVMKAAGLPPPPRPAKLRRS